jgi:ribosome-binding ATPase YchF (GTP1/OBG family)
LNRRILTRPAARAEVRARLQVLLKIAKANVVIPAAVEFVDIAGLVMGATSGEGFRVKLTP